MQVMIERAAGLDVHRETVVACVLIGRPGLRPSKEVRTVRTMQRDLEALRDWLRALCVTHVGMERTGVYWKPVHAVLEGHVDLLVGNARPQDRRKGCRVDRRPVRHGLIAKSFVPPLRKLVESRAAEGRRLLRLLETANVKLASVASDAFGVSGRAMLRAPTCGCKRRGRLGRNRGGSMPRSRRRRAARRRRPRPARGAVAAAGPPAPPRASWRPVRLWRGRRHRKPPFAAARSGATAPRARPCGPRPRRHRHGDLRGRVAAARSSSADPAPAGPGSSAPRPRPARERHQERACPVRFAAHRRLGQFPQRRLLLHVRTQRGPTRHDAQPFSPNHAAYTPTVVQVSEACLACTAAFYIHI